MLKVLGAGIEDSYWLQVSGAAVRGKFRRHISGAANEGPSSFKVADYVPPDILHDIPLFENFDILVRDPVGSMEGPRLVCDPMGVESCILKVL